MTDDKINVIEAMRFFAALAVVFVHIPIVGVGHFGVDAFFVISGFVMMLSTRKSSSQFFTKRLIRILPTYYLFTLGVFAVALVMPTLLNNTTADFNHLVQSLLFIPFDKNGAGHFPILFLGWTLNYEMYFYLLFAIALMISHEYRGHIATGLLVCVIWLGGFVDGFVMDVYSNIIVLEFVLGIAVFHLLDKSWSKFIAISILLFIGLLSYEGNFNHRFFVFGLPSALIIYSCIRLISNKYIPKALVTLGAASYALYLTHPYIIQVFDKLTGWFSGNLTEQSLALIFSLILVSIFSVCVYKFIELPIIGFLRRRFITPSRNNHVKEQAFEKS